MSTTAPEPAVRPWRGWWAVALGLLLTVAAFAPVTASATAPAAGAGRPRPPPTEAPGRPRVPALWMPLDGAVVRGFDVRAGPFGPGHRGIDMAASVGEAVRAPAAGAVVFTGSVAGSVWVSIRVAPGVVATVGPLLGEPVPAGRVRARSLVGQVAPGHTLGGVARPGSVRQGRIRGEATLHLSLRVDGQYVDPLAYLIDRPRPRLAPLLAPGGLPGP
jgi:murein DD-endopeptidase MepM/ murein hydrolase activator NlpD